MVSHRIFILCKFTRIEQRGTSDSTKSFQGSDAMIHVRIDITKETYVAAEVNVNMIFLELQFFFKSGLHIRTCYELLKVYSSPADIAALPLTKLSNLLSKDSHGRFGKQDAKSLKSLAASSVGVKNTYISIQITQTIAQIELIESQLSELEQIICKAMDELDSIIMTVPGSDKLNVAIILGEIGDIHRFSQPSKILAYADLDPVVNQSGKFNAKRVPECQNAVQKCFIMPCSTHHGMFP